MLHPLPRPRLYLHCATAALWALASAAQAQPTPATKPAPGDFERARGPVLTSPVPPGAPGAGPAGAGGAGMSSGSGAGYHSPESPIAPLPQRNDVVPWSVLTDLTKKVTKTSVVPQFNAQQQALDGKVQRIQGFMVPLDAKATQIHFLLTSVPLSCSFCIPGGPESMVEVRAKTPVRHALEPVVVEGRLVLLKNDPYGLYYRLVGAPPGEKTAPPPLPP